MHVRSLRQSVVIVMAIVFSAQSIWSERCYGGIIDGTCEVGTSVGMPVPPPPLTCKVKGAEERMIVKVRITRILSKTMGQNWVYIYNIDNSYEPVIQTLDPKTNADMIPPGYTPSFMYHEKVFSAATIPKTGVTEYFVEFLVNGSIMDHKIIKP